MPELTEPDNPFGWPLPETDALLRDHPEPPLTDPAESLAERLFLLAHKSFSMEVWGGASGRLPKYWDAFADRTESATRNPNVARWWDTVMRMLPGVPLRSIALVHEKNLMIRPSTLTPLAVDDQDVLMVIQGNTLELRDRTRVWVSAQQALRAASAPEPEPIYDEDKQ